MLSLESPRRGDSNEYTHYTISQNKKENHPKLSQICSYGICSKGPKKEFETAVVKEPSVFEPLKFYCMRMNLQYSNVTGASGCCMSEILSRTHSMPRFSLPAVNVNAKAKISLERTRLMQCTVKILNIGTYMSEQTVLILIRLLLRSSLIRIYTVCHTVYIFWRHYCIVKLSCFILRTTTVVSLGVPIFRVFTVNLKSHKHYNERESQLRRCSRNF